MSFRHALEDGLLDVAFGATRGLSWPRALALGASLGGIARRLGVRVKVARDNLARAFPEWSAARRDEVLSLHYAELGRVALEYGRLAELARAPGTEVVAELRGLEPLMALEGRGVVLMSAHFGNFELMGAHVAQHHPIDFVVRALSNDRTEARIARERARAGVGTIDAATGMRNVYRALENGRWIAMLADQDARRHGMFVPFFGTPASTALGPARIALATGAAMVMGFASRRPDGRHAIEILPPFAMPDRKAPDAAESLTRHHVAVLEERVRRSPESWFWVHRRWKTRPS